MKILILKNDKILEFKLPQKIFGDYWITDSDKEGHVTNIINVKEQEGNWVLSSNDNVKILKDGMYHNSLVLSNDDMCTLEFSNQQIKYMLYCAKSYENSYEIFAFNNANEITIGIQGDNGIVYRHRKMTDSKIKLHYENNIWMLDNLNGTNPVYVNHKL